MTILELLKRGVETKKNNLALVYRDQHITYGQLYESIQQTIREFRKLGLRKGDKVVLLVNSDYSFVNYFFSLTSLGCIVIPLDLNIREELYSIIHDSEATAIVIYETLVDERVISKLSSSKLRYIINENYIHSNYKDYQILGNTLLTHDGIGESEEVVSDDLLCFIYTSGTIKEPKGVMLTHHNLLFNIQELRDVIDVDEKDVFFNVLPFFHCYGLCTNLLLPLSIGATIVLHENKNLNDIVRHIQKWNTTVFSCVPTMLEKIKNMINQDMKHIKFISSGAPLPYSVVKYYYEKNDIQIINAYGSSETNTIAVNKNCYYSKQHSVGTLLPSLQTKIVDEDGNELAYGQEGEILLRTPKLMRGYYNLTKETEEVLRDNWFYTGDIGYVLETRELFITGRKKEMFCVAGKKVFKHDVEEILMQSGYFKDVLVEAESNVSRGDLIIAKVVLNDETTINEEQILRYCRRKMSAHKVPKKIIICEHLIKKKTWKMMV
ncbi:AMP-binding protein [Paenibacillus sp. FSL L8-0436]|uniref:class I adenylate-forming enzyme family protein n=1 Tax=Paenibacillus sp. FSL L8-0436 TaxID=2954686 RepID=UPI0031591AD7